MAHGAYASTGLIRRTREGAVADHCVSSPAECLGQPGADSDREHIVIEVSDGDDAEGSVGSAPASPSQEANVPASDQAVNLNISMKVDLARKEAGMSDIAIRAWEKQRRIIIGRVSTLASECDCLLADEPS